MKKKAFAVAALAAACVTSMAFATPQTQFQKGQFQLDLGAWNVKSSVDMSNFDATTMPAQERHIRVRRQVIPNGILRAVCPTVLVTNGVLNMRIMT